MSPLLKQYKLRIYKKKVSFFIKLELQTRKRHQTKQLICLVSVPKPFKEHVYIKSNVELKLALSFIPDHCLGALKETPCTYNYRVSRTD